MFQLEDLRLSDDALLAHVSRPTVQRAVKGFIRPLPLPWLVAAMQIPGAALKVAILLGWQAGLMRSSRSLTIPTYMLDTCGISRRAYFRAVRTLEAAHLITVERQSGQKDRLTIVTRVQNEKRAKIRAARAALAEFLRGDR